MTTSYDMYRSLSEFPRPDLGYTAYVLGLDSQTGGILAYGRVSIPYESDIEVFLRLDGPALQAISRNERLMSVLREMHTPPELADERLVGGCILTEMYAAKLLEEYKGVNLRFVYLRGSEVSLDCVVQLWDSPPASPAI